MLRCMYMYSTWSAQAHGARRTATRHAVKQQAAFAHACFAVLFPWTSIALFRQHVVGRRAAAEGQEWPAVAAGEVAAGISMMV